MSNRTYVCTDCQSSIRAEAAYGRVHAHRCSLCGNALSEVSSRRRIPRKDDTAGWREWAALLARQEREWIPRRIALGQTEIARIDRLLGNARSEARRKKLLSERRKAVRQYGVEEMPVGED
jgi:hypothetical protein